MREIHKYTPKSVAKTVYLNVFLGALIISKDTTQKRPYNNYLRIKKFRLLNHLYTITFKYTIITWRG